MAKENTKVSRKGGKAYLACKLTEPEIKAAGKSLAEALSRRAECEGRLESVKQQIKAEITQAEGDAAKFQQLVATEVEHRMIDVDWVFDFKAGIKETVRTDTGEVVRRDPITDEERQRELPIEPTTEK